MSHITTSVFRSPTINFALARIHSIDQETQIVWRGLHGEQHSFEHAVKLIPACSARGDRETMSHFFVARKNALDGGSSVLCQRRACGAG